MNVQSVRSNSNLASSPAQQHWVVYHTPTVSLLQDAPQPLLGPCCSTRSCLSCQARGLLLHFTGNLLQVTFSELLGVSIARNLC